MVPFVNRDEIKVSLNFLLPTFQLTDEPHCTTYLLHLMNHVSCFACVSLVQRFAKLVFVTATATSAAAAAQLE